MRHAIVSAVAACRRLATSPTPASSSVLPAPGPARGPAGTLLVAASLAALAVSAAGCNRGQRAPGGEATEGVSAPAAEATTESAASQSGAQGTPVADYTEADLLTNVRQLVFEGKRSGEGYFSTDGRYMVFQAEREPDDPFYQIYLMDLETGDVSRVSPGFGKTTCAWIYPGGDKILFASTHEDPEARTKMQELIDLRAAGEAPRYEFTFDDTYDIYQVTKGGSDYENLTNSPGYDAEGSWSPDGKYIAFTSNRLAYTEEMSEEDQKLFDEDPSYMADIYIMDGDGGNVKRLTDHKGYDGGPFFSPDGQRIVYRSFNAEGTLAEIWTMGLDGSDKRQLTRMGAMSWAPFYHPSGDYIIFTTNIFGFQNFELYVVDAAGTKEPVRVTFTDGSDVLPVFTPSGDQLTWVSRRGDGDPQIHIADWNDAKVRELLALAPERGKVSYGVQGTDLAAPDLASTAPEIRAQDARLYVGDLSSDNMQGRLTGTAGEAMATEYVADIFETIGLEPAGDNGYFQPFEFTSGVSLGEPNVLSIQTTDGEEIPVEVDTDWRPLAFSKPGSAGFGDLVFAGYGIVAPEDGDMPAYDSYGDGDLDVDGKWVMVLRYLPEDVTPERRQHLDRYASLRFKAMEARDRGAVGLIVVSGPASQVKEDLVPLRFDASVAGESITAVSMTDELAQRLFAASDRDLADAQAALDGGDEVPGFDLPGYQVGAHLTLNLDKATGRNVLGRLQVGDAPSEQMVVIGAHVDHLGHGEGGDSLARPEEQGAIHPGADDNASGVAGLLEIAQLLADQKAAGELAGLRRDILFAAWSGEELGLLGSSHFVKSLAANDEESIYPHVAAYLNMDMIGRLDKGVVLQGVASSPWWEGEVEKRNVPVGLPLTLSDDTYLPTDATSFYLKGVPILAAFTGAHTDYHTPRDTADQIDYEDLAKVARLMELIAVSTSAAAEPPEYVEVAANAQDSSERQRRVYLGTIPDMTDTTSGGVLLSGVGTDGPADKAGLKVGDTIVELAGQPIDNLYAYSRALDALKIGQEVDIVVLRDGQRVTLKITPVSRE